MEKKPCWRKSPAQIKVPNTEFIINFVSWKLFIFYFLYFNQVGFSYIKQPVNYKHIFMQPSFLQSIVSLTISILLIVLLTTRFKTHAFFALIIACFTIGIGINMPVVEIIEATKSGFGNIIGGLGLIIVFGTALGILLEHTGATKVLANAVLRIAKERKAPRAMNIIGYIVGLPIFCDSGYIVLSSLNNDLARKTGIAVVIMATSLGAGLFAVHCLVPPHPGVAAATESLAADFGQVVLYGMIIAIPSAYSGLLWARYAGRKFLATPKVHPKTKQGSSTQQLPSLGLSIIPIAVPIALIGVRSFLIYDSDSSWLLKFLYTLGAPEVALGLGVLLAILGNKNWKNESFNYLLDQTIEKAGNILLIIGAGGAFGALIAQANIAQHLAEYGFVEKMGIFFPFLLAAILKTAQGSSSVAIITAATMTVPLLSSLGLDTETGKVFTVLALGAGSMMISHANDSYFWIISRFSGVGMKAMIRVFSVSTFVMGIVAMSVIYILYSINTL